ncbi:MAG: MBL fold metallo-hydrolase [Bryobacterales bacterium]|nr:MBL fold metallo-hydrolase [Bryobacterales bacterium]
MGPACSIEVLGSGTSVGIPTIGCRCTVCRSDDPRDRRLRTSVLVQLRDGTDLRNIVIDTSPDFRQQALRSGFRRLDALLFTHDHADHIMGLDDVRPFNYGRRDRIPAYAAPSTLKSLRRVFPYAFSGRATHAGGVPRLDAIPVRNSPIRLYGVDFVPIHVLHGRKPILGFRFGAAAYVTDQTVLPAEAKAQLAGLDVLFLGALRHDPHPTHSTVGEAVALAAELKPRRAFFTHMCHELPHAATVRELPNGMTLAYDGLRIAVGE